MALRHTVTYNQYRGNRRVSGPASEPVTKAEVKQQLRLDADDTSEDTLLDLYITSARESAEELFGFAFINQVWKMTIDRWPGGREPWWDGVRQGAISELRRQGRNTEIIIPRYPLSSVDSITADGQSVTIPDVFIVDTQQQPGRLVLKFGATLPTVSDEAANGIEIEYTAGYGASAADVPADMRLALLQMVATMYTHRGDDCSADDAMKMSGAYAVFSKRKAAML